MLTSDFLPPCPPLNPLGKGEPKKERRLGPRLPRPSFLVSLIGLHCTSPEPRCVYHGVAALYVPHDRRLMCTT